MATHFFGLRDWTFSYSNSVGRGEFAGTGFRNPVDLALGANDVVYVINRSWENRPDGIHVTVCTLGEEYIREFGSEGQGEGQFVWPTAIALDREEQVYVADEWLNRISVFSKDGKCLRTWGKPGSGNGELNGPSGMVIGRDDVIFLVDSKNNRVQKFALDGRYLGQFGRSGDGEGEFNLPWGIALDKDGHVYVADRQNDRVQILAPDGRFIGALYGDNQLSKWAKEKLQSNPDMIRQRALAIAHDRGACENSFSFPSAVRVDDKYRIAVLDSTRSRIQVYTKSKDPVLN